MKSAEDELIILRIIGLFDLFIEFAVNCWFEYDENELSYCIQRGRPCNLRNV